MEAIVMAASNRNINRRQFLQIGSGSVAAILLPKISLYGDKISQNSRPNFLWISAEDINPDLGCYGDTYAVTPNIDKFAAQAVRCENVFSHAPVCAPARSGIITGMYPTAIGTHQMRCKGVPPAHVKCFSEYLRAAGYYCTNNVKTDYQFDPPSTAWDECSNKAHWRNRPQRQPFFAVFNILISHESQIRNRTPQMLRRIDGLAPHEKHDPAKATLPPYYPDTPIVRQDWAQYYDVVTLMDKEFADILKQLEDDGLADDTIVWFWGDNGRGLPRGKRWIYDSGIKVPLIVRIPEKFRKLASPDSPDALAPGAVNNDLIAFIDFAPTMLSLTDIKIPKYIQGRPFLGPQKAEPRDYIFAARDRMDEAYDLIRGVRDKRYKYIRNYMPHVTCAQDIDYMDQMPTMQEMRRLNAEGKLTGPQKLYFLETKPVEELYDTVADPDEVNNLAADPKYKDVLRRMRKVHRQWMKDTGDIGLVPEPEFDEIKRPGGKFQTTAQPTFLPASKPTAEGTPITITCPTLGSSIAYKIDNDKNKKTGWNLYTKSITLKPGRLLHAKACRIGFEDSPEVTFKLGDKPSDQPAKTAGEIPHWMDKLKKTDLLERLQKIKDLDDLGQKAIPGYFDSLADKYASVRYWAVVGLHTTCKEPADTKRAKIAFEKLLTDPSPTVRVTAAHALCDWGEVEKGLPVLLEALEHKIDKARLYAVIALNKIGEKARPALANIKSHLNDPDDYVQRVSLATLKRLENR